MDCSTHRCVLWTSLFWKRPRNAMRTGPKTDFQWYLRGILRPIIFKTIFFLRRIAFMVNFSVLWPTVGTSPCRHCSFSIHSDMHGWTTVGWAGHDACLHTATNEAFAPCPQLINFLRSSNSTGKNINPCTTKSAHLYQHVCHFMYMNQKETYQLMYHEKRTSISTRMSLHVHEPKGNISTHVPRKVHIYINTYVTSCTWTRRKHINSCTTKSATSISTRMSLHVHEPEGNISTHVPRKAHIYINTYVTSCTWTRRKHINSCTTKSAHLYQHVCHFMYMNQKETYQLMYHEKRTAYQHVCHFMYMNQKETYQLMYT